MLTFFNYAHVLTSCSYYNVIEQKDSKESEKKSAKRAPKKRKNEITENVGRIGLSLVHLSGRLIV